MESGDDGAEERHATDGCDAAVGESRGEFVLEIAESVVRVVDDSQPVQQAMHCATAGSTWDVIAHEAVAKDLGAAFREHRERVEDAALLIQVACQAVNDAAERDRIEWAVGDVGHWAKNIANVSARPIARETPCSELEAVGLQIDEDQARIGRAESAAVEAVTRAHADIRVIGRNVLAIVIHEVARVTAPHVLQQQIHDQAVVHPKAELRVRLDRIRAAVASGGHVFGTD
jgi:hypothetical protein